MAEPLLAFEDAACRRGGRLLFEKLSFTLAPGEAAVVTGPNGIGKSSLLRLAAGLLTPDGGRVQRSCAAAFADEGLALDQRLTLGSALGFWARLDGGGAAAGMEAMGLMPLERVPVRMLSAGQRKRAVLARAIASRAPLWLLDEPSNGLDAEGQERLTTATAAHRAQGGAILAASHVQLSLAGAADIAL
ncbi:MAG TPA: heme ABC exporter ATP-binding protein CcmA [Allosphingosinicella sp.]|nr:heme ABC exporter ATP-binding protein CcmA [Allosphingosinicella sp.]